MSERDGPPPAKRRRISERKPRTTEYLDLRSCEIKEEEKPQLERLVRTLHKKRKIVVVAGAGISVSAGSMCQLSIHHHRLPSLTMLRSSRLSILDWFIHEFEAGAQSERIW